LLKLRIAAKLYLIFALLAAVAQFFQRLHAA
jgi:hypothetical protein